MGGSDESLHGAGNGGPAHHAAVHHASSSAHDFSALHSRPLCVGGREVPPATDESHASQASHP